MRGSPQVGPGGNLCSDSPPPGETCALIARPCPQRDKGAACWRYIGKSSEETDAPRVGAPSTGCTRRLDGYADEVTVRIPVQLRQSNSKESENGRVIQLQQLPDERRCGTAGTPASLCPVSAPHACRSRPARSYSLLGVVSRPSSSGATTSTALQVHPP
jgi:hypothetical protein